MILKGGKDLVLTIRFVSENMPFVQLSPFYSINLKKAHVKKKNSKRLARSELHKSQKSPHVSLARRPSDQVFVHQQAF
jgi:hypothetical protein